MAWYLPASFYPFGRHSTRHDVGGADPVLVAGPAANDLLLNPAVITITHNAAPSVLAFGTATPDRNIRQFACQTAIGDVRVHLPTDILLVEDTALAPVDPIYWRPATGRLYSAAGAYRCVSLLGRFFMVEHDAAAPIALDVPVMFDAALATIEATFADAIDHDVPSSSSNSLGFQV